MPTRFKQTMENIAAIHLKNAEGAMRMAANALNDVGTKEAKTHAKEMLGAVKIARNWELALRRQHNAMQRSNYWDSRPGKMVDGKPPLGGKCEWCCAENNNAR